MRFVMIPVNSPNATSSATTSVTLFNDSRIREEITQEELSLIFQHLEVRIFCGNSLECVNTLSDYVAH